MKKDMIVYTKGSHKKYGSSVRLILADAINGNQVIELDKVNLIVNLSI